MGRLHPPNRLIFYENKQNKILKYVTLLIIVTKPIIFHKQTKKSTINAQESMIWYIMLPKIWVTPKDLNRNGRSTPLILI